MIVAEHHYHAEYLNTMIKLFHDPKVFTTRDVYKEIDKYNHIFFMKGAKDTISALNRADEKIFVNTIQPSMIDFRFWKHFKPKKEAILTLHNLNAWNSKGIKLRPNLLHSADSFFASRIIDKILSKFSTIVVVYEPMIKTAKTLFPNHEILYIPFALAQKNVIVNKPGIETWIVVPGTVSSRRRNYKDILNAFDKIEDKDTKLILLGENKDGIKGENILTFPERVSKEVYEFYLRNADLVLCPSHRLTHTVNVATEIYGITKSPNVWDAIKWRKPLLVPSYIPIPKCLESSTGRYVILQYKLVEMLKYLDTLKKEAKKNTENFLPSIIKRRLKYVIE